MPKVFGSELNCLICNRAVTEEGLLHVNTFTDHEGKEVKYGRCSVCFAFHKKVKNGSNPNHLRIIGFSAVGVL